MSIFDEDKPITRKFLKSLGFRRQFKTYRYKNIEFIPCNIPIKWRYSWKKPNSIDISTYKSMLSPVWEHTVIENIYTERDVLMALENAKNLRNGLYILY